MFSATALRLGTCWIAWGAELREQKLRKQLGIPDGHRIYAPIILGYPSEIPPLPERNQPRILTVIE
jgi:nitroreductase